MPVLRADLSEIESIRESLHNVDRILVGNQALVNDALLSFETYTASLATKGEAIESIMRKADDAFGVVDSAIAKIDDAAPGLASGTADELSEKVRSIRELAESFNRKSGAVMEEGRRSLLDISQAATKLTRKFDPQAPGADSPAPRRSNPKRN
jgi:phospholipid/cholesterol/gamma-HCH transport system substrate-binding protein